MAGDSFKGQGCSRVAIPTGNYFLRRPGGEWIFGQTRFTVDYRIKLLRGLWEVGCYGEELTWLEFGGLRRCGSDVLYDRENSFASIVIYNGRS